MKTRKPNRHKNYDYSTASWYFVTICTQNHENYFGEIVNGKMIFNDCGKATEKCWVNIPLHYQYANLEEYIVMPNHIHGIIIVDYDADIVKNKTLRFQQNSII